MSGLRKAKKYDWKDSNMALFGSDTEKQVKKESAESEPAWQGSGQSVGLQIWRVVKFQIECCPKEDYGKFYDGDSYIILNTYKEEDELKYDLHFWIGKYSTQDEYGTAAYKTVELDTFHDDKPVQHREVQGHESALFKSYFKSFTTMKGGADTGFRRVLPEEYKPRLLQFKKNGNKTVMTEVAFNKSKLCSGDVFVLDDGKTIYQWNGENCSKMESYAAAGAIQEIKSERGGNVVVKIVEEKDISDEHSFYECLDAKAEDDDDEDDNDVPDGPPVLMKVSDEDGTIGMEEIELGGENVTMDNLSPCDVFVIDTKKHVFVWVGGEASVEERKNALGYSHNYLQSTEYPWLPITVVAAGRETASFRTAVCA